MGRKSRRTAACIAAPVHGGISGEFCVRRRRYDIPEVCTLSGIVTAGADPPHTSGRWRRGRNRCEATRCVEVRDDVSRTVESRICRPPAHRLQLDRRPPAVRRRRATVLRAVIVDGEVLDSIEVVVPGHQRRTPITSDAGDQEVADRNPIARRLELCLYPCRLDGVRDR